MPKKQRTTTPLIEVASKAPVTFINDGLNDTASPSTTQRTASSPALFSNPANRSQAASPVSFAPSNEEKSWYDSGDIFAYNMKM